MSGLTDGWTFTQAAESVAPEIWGRGDGQIAWAAGEPLMVCGPTGVGKTTLVQQLVLGRLGLRGECIGMSIIEDPRPVLYAAADRPQQIARSLRRMISPADEAILREQLLVWRGPLPFTLNGEPDKLAPFVLEHGAGTLVLDSLKDVALDLIKDDAASRINRSIQQVIAAGVEVLISHHQRKATQGGGKPRTIDDVYGNQAITAGMGSIVLLWGKPGDPIVELDHLKQPADDIGPLRLQHDHQRGHTRRVDQLDVVEIIKSTSMPMTVRQVTATLYGTESPRDADVEKTRRRLERAVSRRELTIATHGDNRQPTTYATIRSRPAHAAHDSLQHTIPPSVREGEREQAAPGSLSLVDPVSALDARGDS